MEAVRGQFEKKEKVNFSFLCDLNCFFPVCVKLSKKKKKRFCQDNLLHSGKEKFNWKNSPAVFI